ncbi:MAG: phosphate signaling complex protein PhoU [Euryarchaeota archaeon]|nr:phosphate signaling complex protein PhoU [Euryarchaeota archaeon]
MNKEAMMVQEQYYMKLASIQQNVLMLGELANSAIKDSVEALQDHNVKQAEAVITGDAGIDSLSADINVLCMQLPVPKPPVSQDLRTIGAVVKINLDIERMSDLAVDIARVVIETKDKKPARSLIDISAMAHIACEMLGGALRAFGELNSDLACEIAKRDDELDALFDQLRRVSITLMIEDVGKLDDESQLTSVAQCLEQIGGHIGNICESVVYMATGDRVKLN